MAEEGEVRYGDKGYFGAGTKGYDAAMRRATGGHPLGIFDLLRNERISKKRSPVERCFSVMKTVFRAGHVRYRCGNLQKHESWVNHNLLWRIHQLRNSYIFRATTNFKSKGEHRNLFGDKDIVTIIERIAMDNETIPKIPLARPYFDSDELDEINGVLNSGWVSQGPKVKEFEDKAAEYLGVKYAIAVANCTAALHLSLLSIGIKEGDEVLVADYTFPATGHSVLYCRAKPVFIDVDSKTYNIDPKLIKYKITNRTKAIIPVHTFGQPAEMDEIVEIAKDHNLKVIEDAACAFGAKYKANFAGTIGDIGCFSFHARKGITTGEGGMAVTNNKTIANTIRNLSIFGVTSAWNREKSNNLIIPKFMNVGYNYKMSDVTAAIGVAQLRKLEKIIERKRELAKHWDEKLQDIDLVESPYVSDNVRHIYQSYVVLIDKRIDRNKMIEILLKNGVQTQIGTYASHLQPVYKSNDNCPISLDIFNRSSALPMYYQLSEEEIDTVIDSLKVVMGELKLT